MEQKLYLVAFGSEHWCGCDETVLVYAESKDEANYLTEEYRANTMRELLDFDPDDGYEEDEYFNDTVYSIKEYDGNVDGPLEWYEIVNDYSKKDIDPGEMDGDAESALKSVGWGTDEDYMYESSDF